MSNEYLDEIWGGCGTVDHAAYSMEADAESFYRIGNEAMAEKLWRRAEKLREAAQRIRSAVSKDINQTHDENMAAARNVVQKLIEKATA